MTSTCPGCGLEMPTRANATGHAYYNAAPECWSVYTEVLAAEYSNAILFGQVHQLTVDAYAAQHAGADHPDKSVGIHLAGLYLVLERGSRPTAVPPLLQQLAGAVATWPHLTAPKANWPLTVFDVALSASVDEHIETARSWSRAVWHAWKSAHPTIASIVAEHVGDDPPVRFAGG